MASPGPEASGTKPEQRALPADRWSKAITVMMDQQSFEATRPVSADPAVALAEALGQLPKVPVTPSAAKPHIIAKTSVEDLASELGLTLGDQNGVTIRRVKRGK